MAGGDIYLTDFPVGVEWVNVDEPPRPAELRGKAVLVNFWTGSSVACEQQAQELRQLEAKFHDGLAILGVHTPRHPAEAETDVVLKTANRWHLRHPVANDREWVFWRMLGIDGWPSAALFDHESRLVATFPGEGRRAEIEARIQQVLDKAAELDTRNYDAPPVARKAEPRAPLRFPTRIVATDAFLYVADTGYNRVLELGFDGRVNRQFGSGNPGHWDARATEAGFRDPVGLALWKDFLFVADTGNHAIRRVRLMSGDVETLAGNGMCDRPPTSEVAQPRQSPLTTPIDLVVHGDRLYVAMAGAHQIWQLELGRGVLSLIAGNGREDGVDGTASFCSFAQPSALAIASEHLYVLDSSTSTLRAVRLGDARVTTLVNGGLFSDGVADGPGMAARMCHPTALHADAARGVLWITDALNHKLRVYSLAKSELKSLNINYRLQSPSGICIAQQAVWIANTDAHEILKLDLKSGKLSRLPITT